MMHYLPDIIPIDDYHILASRFWGILKAFPEFNIRLHTKRHKNKDSRRIIRFRKDKLTVVFICKHNIHDRCEIRIDCDNKQDKFNVYDSDAPNEYVISFVDAYSKSIAYPEDTLKSEILDFIDDYCTIN